MLLTAESLRARSLGLRKDGDRDDNDGDALECAKASSAGLWGTTIRFFADPPRRRGGAEEAEADVVDEESKLHSRWRGACAGDGCCCWSSRSS
jgi:hypothetical protein